MTFELEPEAITSTENEDNAGVFETVIEFALTHWIEPALCGSISAALMQDQGSMRRL